MDPEPELSKKTRQARHGTIYQNGHKVSTWVTRLHHRFARQYKRETGGTYVPSSGDNDGSVTWRRARESLDDAWAEHAQPKITKKQREAAWFIFELLCPDSPRKTTANILRDYVNEHWYLNPDLRKDSAMVPTQNDQKAAKRRALGMGKDLVTQMTLPAVDVSSRDAHRDANDGAILQLISQLSESVNKQQVVLERFFDMSAGTPQTGARAVFEDDEAELLRRLEAVRARKREVVDLEQSVEEIETQRARGDTLSDADGELGAGITCGDKQKREGEQEQEVGNSAHHAVCAVPQTAPPDTTRRSTRVRKRPRR